MDKLTVFHVDGERVLRGGQRQTLILAQGLRRRGHHNIIVCRAGGEMDREAAALGFERLRLPFLFEFDPLSAYLLRRRALQAGRPLLHAHTGRGAALAALAALGGGLPRVAHRRVAFTLGQGVDFKLKYGGADRLIALSGCIRAELVRGGADPEKIRIIPCCFEEGPRPGPQDTRAFRAELARQAGLAPDRLWIGTLAALTPEKGMDVLLRAYSDLKKRHPAAALLIAGEGPLRGQLTNLTRRLGIEDGVRFLGYRHDPDRILLSLDIYVQPSLSEGLGSSVVQAMALGVPVAASDAGGLAEVVREGRSGLSVPAGDPAALAEALGRLAASPELRRKLAETALEDVQAYASPRIIERTERVYAEIYGEVPVAA